MISTGSPAGSTDFQLVRSRRQPTDYDPRGAIVVQGLRDHRAKQRHYVTRPVTDCDRQFQVGLIVVDDETDEPFLSRRQRAFMSLTPGRNASGRPLMPTRQPSQTHIALGPQGVDNSPQCNITRNGWMRMSSECTIASADA
jgi:hypothetical protein